MFQLSLNKITGKPRNICLLSKFIHYNYRQVDKTKSLLYLTKYKWAFCFLQLEHANNDFTSMLYMYLLF